MRDADPVLVKRARLRFFRSFLINRPSHDRRRCLIIALLMPLGLAVIVAVFGWSYSILPSDRGSAVLRRSAGGRIQLLFALAVLGLACSGGRWCGFARSLTSGRSITLNGAWLLSSSTASSASSAGASRSPITPALRIRSAPRCRGCVTSSCSCIAIRPARCFWPSRIGSPQGEVDRLARLLDLAEIPSREAYRLSLMRGIFGPRTPAAAGCGTYVAPARWVPFDWDARTC